MKLLIWLPIFQYQRLYIKVGQPRVPFDQEIITLTTKISNHNKGIYTMKILIQDKVIAGKSIVVNLDLGTTPPIYQTNEIQQNR